MCIEMRVSGNYPYFLCTERSYFQNRLASAHVLFHYSLGTQSPTHPTQFFPPLFSFLPYRGHGADCSASLWVSSPGCCLAPWLVTANVCVVIAHFIAGYSLPWPHLRLNYSTAYIFSRGRNQRESV